VLLFGASGFLGGRIRAALAPYADLSCPSRLECDLLRVDVPTLAASLTRERPDAVVVAAGRIVGSAYDFVAAHTAATAKLLDAMADAAPDARLVRIGSAAEYGVVPHGHAVREDEPAAPVGDYGLSHLAATRLVELAAAAGRVDGVALRVFNPIGPGMPAGNLLGRAADGLRAALAEGRAELSLGVHDTYRDFVDVRDVAAAVRAALSYAPSGSRIFNVASGRAVPTRVVVRQLADVAGFTGTITDGAFPPDAARSSAVPWMCADLDRSAAVLGWRPVYSLADSLASVWAEVADGRTASPVPV
jgi:nucleoside-diphosphate-sugar epimerase